MFPALSCSLASPPVTLLLHYPTPAEENLLLIASARLPVLGGNPLLGSQGQEGKELRREKGCASSSPSVHTMYSAYKLNKQGDNIQV